LALGPLAAVRVAPAGADLFPSRGLGFGLGLLVDFGRVRTAVQHVAHDLGDTAGIHCAVVLDLHCGQIVLSQLLSGINVTEASAATLEGKAQAHMGAASEPPPG